jgi:hypothetical protein
MFNLIVPVEQQMAMDAVLYNDVPGVLKVQKEINNTGKTVAYSITVNSLYTIYLIGLRHGELTTEFLYTGSV